MARASIPEKESGGGDVARRESKISSTVRSFSSFEISSLTSSLKEGGEPSHEAEEESVECQEQLEGREEAKVATTQRSSPTDSARQDVLSEGSRVLPVSLN